MPGSRAEPGNLEDERHDRREQRAADRLDASWDALIRGGAADLSAPGDGDAARTSLVSYIDLLTPRPDPATRERLRRRIAAAQKEPSMTAPSLPLPSPSANGHRGHDPWPQVRTTPPNDRRWWHRPLGAFQVATTVALIVATLGGILLIRPNDDRPSLPAASSPNVAAGTPEIGSGGGSLVNLLLDGPESGEISVSVNRVTLPSGIRWDFKGDEFADVANPGGLSVESGMIAVGTDDREYEVPTGGNFGVDGGPTYLRNAGTESAVILLLAAHPAGGATFAPPAELTVEPIVNVSLPLSIFPDGSQRIVTLSRASYSGAGAPALPLLPQQRTIFVAVESGSMTARTTPDANVLRGAVGAPSLSVPADFAPSAMEGTTLLAGETLTVSPTHGISETTILGDESVETLSLEVTTWTLPAPSSTAPPSLRWDVPPGDQAQVGFALRRFTLDPGAVRIFEVYGVLAIHGIDGTVVVANAGDGNSHSVAPGQFLIGERSGLVEIRNTDTRPATFIEGIVFAGEVSPNTWAGGTGPGWTVKSLGTAFAFLPSGPATVELFPEAAAASQGISVSTYPGNGFRLIGTLSGSFQLIRLAGEVSVQSSESGSEETRHEEPMLGVPVDVAAGDAIVAQPRSGYTLSSDDLADAQLITLSVASEAPLDETDPGPRADELTTVDAAACQAEPRDIQTLYDILGGTGTDATPDARTRDETQSAILGGTGTDVMPDAGPRDDVQSFNPADAATTEAVTAIVRESLACVRFGTPLQGYALFTDDALRVAFAANGFTTEDIDAMADQPASPDAENGPVPVFAIDDIVVFPDGRAGAIVNADGEIAYLTFVLDPDAGRWLIDAWDDREPGTVATPAP